MRNNYDNLAISRSVLTSRQFRLC